MTANTIVALSSGAGKAGVAVLRVSGEAAGICLQALVGHMPSAREARLVSLHDPGDATFIDRGLVLWFPGPQSFTGEDVVEFQVHGSPAVVDALVACLCRLSGVRPAEPGEFTRRAFDNGKMDLSAAEGLADLIDAETEAQRIQAQRQMGGILATRCADWGDRLRRALAWLEAAIDFPDEDLPADLFARLQPDVEAVRAGLIDWLAAPDRGRVVRNGFRVAIVGPPNAGKSSLINQIARRDVAIVAATSGTTRDVIEARVDLNGYPVVFVDTAGLRDERAADPVEREGMARARAESRSADLVLSLVDLTRPGTAVARDAIEATDGRFWTVANKIDLAPPDLNADHVISARTGAGIDDLLAAIARTLSRDYGTTEHPALTRVRHRAALEEAADALRRATAADAAELMAEDLRLALRAMERLIGKTDVEALLDAIFRDFCIGK
ncbi:MAG: tRNA uridine-5-carboxymethylaminomethyl(34) synthesis GTPase MnmE [Rhodospirillaceae bacterium]|nr:tRNA uridine-5-carboxymethylaminomethyl(34) synthesis GTPase MnmE [Rhodospirillaceae bacterium]